MNINKVMIAGNLTRDVDVRYTGSGTAVGNMGMAINRRYKGKDGNVLEDTTFVDVTLWGKDAENAQQYLQKGAGVFVEGRLTVEEWDDKETGRKRHKMIVTCERLQFASRGGNPSDGGDRRQDRGTPPAREQRPQPGRFDGDRVPSPGGGMFDRDDDGGSDIPFRFHDFDTTSDGVR